MTVLQIAGLILGITGSASPISFIPRPADDPSRRQPDVGLPMTCSDGGPP
jgi:dTDP-glucose 4,6-dehydratase